MEFRDFHIKDFEKFNQLAYKAVFERGFVDTEFDKQNWNTHMKRLVSLNSNVEDACGKMIRWLVSLSCNYTTYLGITGHRVSSH